MYYMVVICQQHSMCRNYWKLRVFPRKLPTPYILLADFGPVMLLLHLEEDRSYDMHLKAILLSIQQKLFCTEILKRS